MVMEVTSAISLPDTVILFSDSQISLPLRYLNGDGAGKRGMEKG
ncbi:hypothetical protein A2U01_0039778 [Trifolium medium]|uniref:Uncharacterized protein n=1 Tax=Trifolium medium TaxID=97028 RepID=A0A392Q2J5_9FABA|nr:hypothetical protein [Trifolium medium]